MPRYNEERQPPEWEEHLTRPSRPRNELLAHHDVVFERLPRYGRVRTGPEFQPVRYGRDENADPAGRYNEQPPPRPWEREDPELFVRRLLHQLPEREAHVVRMRWGIGQPERSQAYICRRLGIGRATSYRIERRAFARMRALLGIPDEEASGLGAGKDDGEPGAAPAAA